MANYGPLLSEEKTEFGHIKNYAHQTIEYISSTGNDFETLLISNPASELRFVKYQGVKNGKTWTNVKAITPEGKQVKLEDAVKPLEDDLYCSIENPNIIFQKNTYGYLDLIKANTPHFVCDIDTKTGNLFTDKKQFDRMGNILSRKVTYDKGEKATSIDIDENGFITDIFIEDMGKNKFATTKTKLKENSLKFNDDIDMIEHADFIKHTKKETIFNQNGAIIGEYEYGEEGDVTSHAYTIFNENNICITKHHKDDDGNKIDEQFTVQAKAIYLQEVQKNVTNDKICEILHSSKIKSAKYLKKTSDSIEIQQIKLDFNDNKQNHSEITDRLSKIKMTL